MHYKSLAIADPLELTFGLAPNEVIWFNNTLQDALDELPASESEFISQQLARADHSRFLPKEYGLEA